MTAIMYFTSACSNQQTSFQMNSLNAFSMHPQDVLKTIKPISL